MKDNNNAVDKIWSCAEDLIGFANDLESSGRTESGERVRTIINELEKLCEYMKKHPRK